MILNNVRMALTGQKISISVKDGKIEQILPRSFFDKKDEAILNFDDAIIFPGLINSVRHVPQTLF